jgi:hypothetical protein
VQRMLPDGDWNGPLIGLMFTPGRLSGGVMVTVAGDGAVTVTVDGGAAVPGAAVDVGVLVADEVSSAVVDEEQATVVTASAKHAMIACTQHGHACPRYGLFVMSPVPFVD